MINSKTQITNYKQIQNNNLPNSKHYDLEERSFLFAKHCRDYVKQFPRTISNIEYGKQLVRASGSQAANYIEANESLSKKDFLMRIKICRKETKESRLWLRLTECDNTQTTKQQNLINEAIELTKIYSSIAEKSK